MSETKTYRIHAAPTGYGRQVRIIVTCDGQKWDDILCPYAAVANRRLREYRAKYHVKRAARWPSHDAMDIWS